MRKALILLVIVVLMLTFPITTNDNQEDPFQFSNSSKPSNEYWNLASAGGSGSSIPAMQYMSRVVTSEQISILNSYADTNLHSGEIDLSGYLESGWHVYKVDIDVNSLTAAPEREVIGITNNNSAYVIEDYSGTWYSQLAQGFYNQPFNGSLQNYSLLYSTLLYDPVLRGNASIHINSGYFNIGAFMDSTILTTKENLTASESVYTWATVSGEGISLDSNTVYWAVINGSTLMRGGVGNLYPYIYWYAEGGATGYQSKRWTGSLWDDKLNLEAILNYTYTPWNRSTNAALEFASPESLSLQADSVAQTGFSWKFIDGISNITSIQIETNQSIYLNYDITIWYQKSPTVTTNWIVDTSGNPVVWNSTTTLIYPVFPQATTKYLNLTVESDWDFQGLYNSTYPETNYTHTYRVGDMITCTAMSDETWTLSCSAPNYVTDIALSDSFDSSPITDYVDIQVDMEIDATVEDGGGTPITGGSTNLTVLQSGTGVYKPTNIPASGGIASYLWNIDSTTSGNGTHYIEVFWTNGLEAGYFVTQVFVYYPTTLVADDIVINAYAENTFDIGVDFDDTFLVRGLDGSLASVEYSFDGGANTSLLDQNGGRWTATVSTAGKTNGTYQLVVYAEGLALENQSLTITVNLIYQTQALGVNWSPTNNIPYLNTTKLSITYKIMDGTNITDAIVNVTFQSSTYDMAWDSLSQTYWIDLTGENFTGVPGTFNLNVSAWKKGYEVQVDDTITITIGSQTGEFFEVIYNPDTLNISYIETLFIQVTYEYNSLPINSSTSVNVTFNGGSPVTLTYNPGSTKWEVTLQGRDHFGTWTINVTASASGYTTRWNSTTFIVHEDTPIISSNLPVNVRTDYDHSVTFSVFVTDSIGTAINDANVSFTAFGTFHNYTSGASGEYVITIAPWTTRGPHEFTVIVIRAGYTTSELNFTIIVDASTSFGFEASSYEEYEQWDLTINVEYLDTFYSTPILNAIVNVTIDGNVYPCEFVGYYYQANVTLDLTPGIYTIEAAGSASYANAHTNQVNLDVDAKEVVHIVIEFVPPQVIAGELMEVRATLWSNDSELVMPGFNIHFEISIYYSNGTVIHYTAANQIDTTNSEGVATYSFDVPEGQIDRLSATATYAGQREIWGAQTTKTAGVTVNILSLLFAFLFSDIGLMIILSIALLGIVAAGYNRGVKPKKKLAKLNLENQLQMFNDLETVQHFMAVYLDRGTCVFYHPFTEDRIQPDLISGFIAAITSVYGEIKGDGVRGTLEEIQYHGLRLNSYSGQYIIGILILEGEMTPLLRERLQFFVELFENQYERDLDHWTGLVDCFDPEWVVSTLNAAFNYSWHLPHRFGPTQKVTKTDAKMLDYISAVRDERNEFYIKNLLAPLAEMLEKTEAEVLDRLLLLEERGIIMPIGVQTILQRQGLTLADGAEEQIIRPPESLDESEAVLEFDELEEPQEPTIEEETEIEPPPEPVTEKEVEAPSEPEPEHDSMEAFVQDVESLLISKAKEEDKTEDAELDQFVKELKDKIGEDEESED